MRYLGGVFVLGLSVCWFAVTRSCHCLQLSPLNTNITREGNKQTFGWLLFYSHIRDPFANKQQYCIVHIIHPMLIISIQSETIC